MSVVRFRPRPPPQQGAQTGIEAATPGLVDQLRGEFVPEAPSEQARQTGPGELDRLRFKDRCRALGRLPAYHVKASISAVVTE